MTPKTFRTVPFLHMRSIADSLILVTIASSCGGKLHRQISPFQPINLPARSFKIKALTSLLLITRQSSKVELHSSDRFLCGFFLVLSPLKQIFPSQQAVRNHLYAPVGFFFLSSFTGLHSTLIDGNRLRASQDFLSLCKLDLPSALRLFHLRAYVWRK